jgi:hypothetical protein
LKFRSVATYEYRKAKKFLIFIFILFFYFFIHLAENSGLRFEPNEIQVDFEIATIKAIENLFPNCIVKGCLFHFTRAIWRKVQNLGLARFYNTDIRVRKLIHRIMRLALLPIEKFQEVWDLIFEDCPENCKDLLDYFVTTWFDEFNALFHREIWNQFGNLEARTNNHIEGWHNSFNKKVNESHPSVYRLINFIRNDQEDNTKNIIQLSQGISLSRKRTNYAKINQQIINLWMRFQHDSQNPILPIEFLDKVGFLLHKN